MESMTHVPAPDEFVRLLGPAVRQAAAIARALEGRVANRPKAGEATDVKAALTVADTAAQEAVLVPLLRHFPRVGLEAEEDTPTAHRFPLDGDGRVVIDPIDGTLRFYLDGAGPYAVMVGLAVKGRYEAALVALPREGLMFDAVRGAGARVARGDERRRPLERLGARARGRRVLVSTELPEAAARELAARGYELQPACGGAISVAPLLPGVAGGIRMAVSARSVSVRGRIGALIAAEAGALVRTGSGDPFPEELSTPARTLLVAARPEDLDALQKAAAAGERAC